MSGVRVRRVFLSVLSIALVLAALSAFAPGGASPARADTDPGLRVDGKPLTGTGDVTLASGQRIDTGAAPARVRMAAGGTLNVAPRSAVVHQGVERGVESFFVVAGSAEAPLTEATIVGATSGWARCEPGGRATVRVTIPATSGAAVGAATFRAVAGLVVVEYFAVVARIPTGCEATLSPGGDGPGSVAFAASAANRGAVTVVRRSGDASHVATVPAGVAGVLADRGTATRFVCRAAPTGSLLGLDVRPEARAAAPETAKGGARPSSAAAARPKETQARAISGAIGPGAAAVLDSGAIRIDVPGLGAGAIDRLLRATDEFSTQPIE